MNASARTPISPKVANGSLSGGALSVVTWILVTTIPAFHHGIPAIYQPLIPALLGIVGYFGAGYKSTHQATVQEIDAAIQQAEQVVQLFEAPGDVQPWPQPQKEPAQPAQVTRAELVSEAAIRDYLANHPARLVTVAREREQGQGQEVPIHTAPPTAQPTSEVRDDAHQ